MSFGEITIIAVFNRKSLHKQDQCQLSCKLNNFPFSFLPPSHSLAHFN